MIFQVLDPQEIKPDWRDSVMLEDIETQQAINVAPDYLADQYRKRLDAHLESLRKAAAGVGAHQLLVRTDEPLDAALRRYLLFRQGKH
jgi:uncharacterized protein (DUF58 family)